MKVESKVVNVQSTMMGEKVAMGVQAEDMTHIMGILTDLYKNRLRAIIREYFTNAWDAHVEAGISLPVEVTLPNALTPTFKVRDYGTGLDAEGIRKVYSQYGRSTKRDTNDQVGMLGLGSKSALTYSDQFTVVSIKNGRRMTVLVSRDEDGAGSMQILGNPEGEPTDDASGTEISVAIRREDIGRCAIEAADVYSYCPEGTVLVNGEQPEHFTSRLSCLRLSDTLYVSTKLSEDQVVMGNVAYPQSLDVGTGSNHRDYKVIAFVPIGSVKPTPSRESLMDTKLTKETLSGVKDQYAQTITGAIQREVSAAATPQDAVKVVVGWARYVPGSSNAADYTYKGHTLPAVFTPTNPATKVSTWRTESGLEVTDYSSYRKLGQTTIVRDLPISQWATTVWVEDFEPAKFTAQHKNKLLKWVRDNGINTDRRIERFALLREKAPDSIFVERTMVVKWETIKAIKLDPPAPRNGIARIPGSFDVVTEGGYKHGVPGSELRQYKPLFWVKGNQWSTQRFQEACQAIYPAFTLVLLPENRIAKFCRDVPKAVKVDDAINAAYKKWTAGVNSKDALAVALHDNGDKGKYAVLNAAKVKDPALASLVKVAQRDVSRLLTQRKAFERVVYPISRHNVTYTDVLSESYPLYRSDKSNHAHTYLYLNAAFAAA